jgi:hypothetical protein
MLLKNAFTSTYFNMFNSMYGYFYSKTNEIHQFLKFILFCSSTLHVSDGPSIHHQESKTVHTASGIFQTDSADCLRAGTRWFYLVPAGKQSAKSV